MAMVYCDGFDSYAASADLSKKWATVGTGWTFGSAAGRTGGGAVSITNTSASALKATTARIIANNGAFGVAFWFKVSNAPAAETRFFQLLNINGTEAASFRLTTSGTINFYTDRNAIGNANVCDNAWHWFECVYTAANNNTFPTKYQPYVDGNLDFTFGGTNVGGVNLALSTFQLMSLSDATITFDDVIVLDNTGTSMASGTVIPLGPRQITTLRPNSDSSVQFTRSTGASNYALVDETVGDPSDYVESGTSGDQDLYGYPALGFTPATITAAMVNSYLHNPNPGSVNHQQICLSNATQAAGPSVSTPLVPTLFQVPFYVDPNTSAAWTAAGVNAAKFGIKVV